MARKKPQRASKRLGTRLLNACFTLYRHQPWLAESQRQAALLDLFKLCGTLPQQSLILNLLRRFRYVSVAEYTNLLSSIANRIISDWRLNENTTQVASASYDARADSSHAILQDIKPVFAARDWHNYKDTQQLGKVASRIQQFPDVVILDEFVGTGETMLNRVRTLSDNCRRSLEEHGIQEDFSISVAVIAATTIGKEAIEREGIRFSAEIVMSRGISDSFTGDKRTDAVTGMELLESRLAPIWNTIPLPSFGYGRCEALYAKEAGNTPNSVFPVFWWPLLRSGKRRQTILHRREPEPDVQASRKS